MKTATICLLAALIFFLAACKPAGDEGIISPPGGTPLATFSFTGPEVFTPTPQPDPSGESCPRKLAAVEGVKILFTAPYKATCQVYHVKCVNVLTLGADCLAEIPANNIQWGKFVGISGIGLVENPESIQVPAGYWPAKQVVLNNEGFGIKPAEKPGSSQIALMTVMLNEDEVTLVLPFKTGALQATVVLTTVTLEGGPTPTPGGKPGNSK